MRHIFIITLLVLIALAGVGQTVQKNVKDSTVFVPSSPPFYGSALVYVQGRFHADTLYIQVRDTTWHPSNIGTVTTPDGINIYIWDGTMWNGIAGVTIEGDTTVVNNINITRSLRLPRSDTIHAVQKKGSAIYDTLLDHYYGYVQAPQHWRCFDCDGGGSGTVTNFSAGNLSPLFTTSVATSTTTPALTFILTNAGANTVLGNATGSSGAPSYGQIVNGQITNATIVASTKLSATGTPSATTSLFGDNTWKTVSLNPINNVYAPLIKSGDTISRRYNVLHYGATGDGVYDTTISITTGTPNVTSTNSIFAVSDVGKVIVIVGAGTSGRDFVGTISAYVSATAVTVSSNAATTVTNAPTLFGTDQTAAIQATINAAYNGGGGEVVIPNGIYIIAGALQTSVGGVNMNAQLYIPTNDYNSHQKTHIKIVGETPPNFTQYAALVATKLNSYKGSVLVSTLTSGATRAAVIGTKGTVSTFGTYNYNYLTVENLSIKVLDNPAGAGPVVGGISYKNGSSPIIRQVYVGNLGVGQTSVIPTNDLAGIETPDASSESMTYIELSLVTGFKNGYIIGEHTVLDQAEAFICYYGFNFKFAYHAIDATRILSQWCTNDIYFSGASQVEINSLAIEYMYAGLSGGKWYDNLYTINDSLNQGSTTLSINYLINKAGVGHDNAHFTINGAANIRAICDTTQLVIAGHVNSFSSTTYTGTYLKNTSSTGAAAYNLENNNSIIGGISLFGSGHAVTGLRNKVVLSGSGDVEILPNSATSSGGSGVARVNTGGYANTSYTATFTAGAPGNALFFGSVGIGGITSPSKKLDITTSTSADGVQVTQTANANSAGFNTTNSSGIAGSLFSYGSSFSVTSLQNKVAFGSTGSMVIIANGGAISGGATTISLRSGGYDAAAESMLLSGSGALKLDFYGSGTFTGTPTKALSVDASGNVIETTLSAGGSVTSFSAGNLSPLFTTSVATATTTPALTFALTNAAANTWFGNNTGSSAAPSYNAFGTGVNTWITTPSSANLLAALTDETGTGLAVFATNPTMSGMTMADATNIVLNTTTGSKIGTATGQKLGFYNATPVVQQTGSVITGLNTLGLFTGATITLASSDFANQGTTTTVLHGNAAGNPAFGAVVQGDVTNGYLDLASAQTAAGTKSFTASTNNFNTTTNVFRNTNGGSNVTSVLMIDESGSPTTAGSVAVAFEPNGGETFTTSNGTRRKSIAAITITNLTTTAGSEAGDLIFSTVAAGAAPTTKLTITSGGNVTVANGDLTLGTAGNKLAITEGTNGRVGQTTLVSGVKAISITGLTTSSRAFISFVSQGGTSTGVFQYAGVCTANTLTITALTVGGTTVTTDTSVVNYFIVN